LADTGAKIIGMVHDEIILEAPEGVATDSAEILRKIMIEAREAFLSRVQIEVEVTIGETWAEK
jgi:DNA polymerase I